MSLMDETDILSQRSRPGPRRLSVALIGGGSRAASMLRMVYDLSNVDVAALWSPQRGSAAVRLADELGVYVAEDMSEVFQISDVELVIDLADDPRISAELEQQRPGHLGVMGPVGAELVWDLLVAKKRGEEQERLFVELQVAYDKIRGHERRLQSSKTALERANEELESRLAEIFFTHEFFKALTSYTAVDDVCSLIVDGCNGILGAEISCVYLFNREDWTLVLKASQGRPEYAFRPVVPVSETIVGYAFREGSLQESAVEPGSPSAAWVIDPSDISSHAAVPLRAGENVFGVMVVASSARRDLSVAEMERLQVLGNQSSLSLQNAILHGELERLSVTDRLTEMYNHGYFQQRLEEEFKRTRRFSHPLSLIMIDIDDFKAFNDTYGHVSGDLVLKGVSAVIRQNLREMDVAARYGGEEFALLLPETDCDGAKAVAERIRAGCEELVWRPAHDVAERRTVSVGVASYPQAADDPMRLLEAADKAMYSAKKTGKNRVGVAAGC